MRTVVRTTRAVAKAGGVYGVVKAAVRIDATAVDTLHSRPILEAIANQNAVTTEFRCLSLRGRVSSSFLRLIVMLFHY